MEWWFTCTVGVIARGYFSLNAAWIPTSLTRTRILFLSDILQFLIKSEYEKLPRYYRNITKCQFFCHIFVIKIFSWKYTKALYTTENIFLQNTMNARMFLFLFLFLFWCSSAPEAPLPQQEEFPFSQTGETLHTGALVEREVSFSGTSQDGPIVKIPSQSETAGIQNHGGYDFLSDDSYQKFVNNEISFTQKSYIPEDLEKISWEFIIDTKGNQTLRKEVVKNLHLLAQDFYTTFWEKLVVVSAYRSYAYQVGIKQRGCSDLYCAKAWYSEHQSWLAFDLFEASSQDEFLAKTHLKKYYDWLSENAHLYGFHNTYQKGKNIDGYAIEPWHWRYVWVELATQLKNEGKTFAEFVKE